jgi:hypothetical protein
MHARVYINICVSSFLNVSLDDSNGVNTIPEGGGDEEVLMFIYLYMCIYKNTYDMCRFIDFNIYLNKRYYVYIYIQTL